MLMLLSVFVTSFLVVGVVGMAIAWAMSAQAELEAWKRKHQRWVDAENRAAWHGNRQMIVY